MPEGLEAELYRRSAERALHRQIESVTVDERQAMAVEIAAVLPGASFTRADRRGKVVVLELEGATPARSLGLHFGMTGRLVVDGDAAIAELEYSSRRDDAAWDRFLVRFADGGAMRVNDPRRWAKFVLDPDLDRLGPDFLSVTAEHVTAAFARRRTPVKSALLDQAVVAGYGNMCVDEVLWQVGLSPVTPAREVAPTVVRRLVEFAPDHLREMLELGGSHRGVIDPEVRAAVPPCPRDGAPMRREQVGGRTTIWCPAHQHGGEPFVAD
ncbi:MAG: DNA-formamidopyrimidine glycosylase family protein [Ilumatobacteraceae bacterium]|nr:DNA-formamidopyrimidine glycosylase family protein [Ilumatobacteraceae bacterium]